MNRWHVFNEMVEHYRSTGEVMGPAAFQQRFAGQVSSVEAVNGLYEFEKFLDVSRCEAKAQ